LFPFFHLDELKFFSCTSRVFLCMSAKLFIVPPSPGTSFHPSLHLLPPS
jgi:hypothetical protein